MNINGRTRLWLLVILSLGLVLHSCRADGVDLPPPDGEGAPANPKPEGEPEADAATDAAAGAAVDPNANPIPEVTEPAVAEPPADFVTEPPVDPAVVEEPAVTEGKAPQQGEQAPAVTAAGDQPVQQEEDTQTSGVPVAQTTQVETTTVLITTTTAEPTTTEPFVEIIKLANYTVEMKGGLVTIKLKKKISRRERQRLIQAIIKQLNKNQAIIDAKLNRTAETSSGVTSAAEISAEGATTVAQVITTAGAGEPVQQQSYRRKRSADGTNPEFSEDNVEFMDDDEEYSDTVSIAVPTKTGGYIDPALISEALEKNKEEIENDSGVMISSFKADSAPEYVSDIHYKLLITIIVLISVSLFVILFCMFCIRYCPRQPASSEQTPMTMEEARPLKATPIVQSSPFTDDKLVKGETPLVSATAGPSLQSAPPEGQASP